MLLLFKAIQTCPIFGLFDVLEKVLVLKYRKAWSSTVHYAAGVELRGTCHYTSYFFICMLPFNFYFYKKSSIDACGHISQCM